jgi:hypothetical protein
MAARTRSTPSAGAPAGFGRMSQMARIERFVECGGGDQAAVLIVLEIRPDEIGRGVARERRGEGMRGFRCSAEARPGLSTVGPAGSRIAKR